MALNISVDDARSHWSKLIEDFQASPLGFYRAIEEALHRRQIPHIQNARVDYREGGPLSAGREYLHVTRDKLALDICGAPFGTGFFVSWWLSEERMRLHPVARIGIAFGMVLALVWLWSQTGIIATLVMAAAAMTAFVGFAHVLTADGNFDDGVLQELPFLGALYRRLFKSNTYYRTDTMLMFQEAVHNAVLEVIDGMTTAQGLRALADSDRTPIMREFYSRNT